SLVEQQPTDDPDTEINLGCLLYKEGHYEEACKKFTTAMQVVGYKPDLTYNIALCYYSMKQYAPALKYIAEIIEHEAAQEALTDMPPRSEEELDPVTLHNQALMNMDSKPTEGFEKLQFLLQQNPFPPETFGNLLLLYCKYENYYYKISTCTIGGSESILKYESELGSVVFICLIYLYFCPNLTN
ncbi:hypothetical protein scyTo_0019833, partial [Scyliorhinus torazame]|nr:hypothetical protein [Scyliorhinus torazame]